MHTHENLKGGTYRIDESGKMTHSDGTLAQDFTPKPKSAGKMPAKTQAQNKKGEAK